jgi:hypothetical protein
MRHNRILKKIVAKLGGYRPFYDDDVVKQSTETEQTEQSQEEE